MRPLNDIMRDVCTPDDAEEALRLLEYAYPHCETSSPEQAIALRAFTLLDEILERDDA